MFCDDILIYMADFYHVRFCCGGSHKHTHTHTHIYVYIFIPLNFLGGFSRSPPAGSTTQRSSTSLKGESIKHVNLMAHKAIRSHHLCGHMCVKLQAS